MGQGCLALMEHMVKPANSSTLIQRLSDSCPWHHSVGATLGKGVDQAWCHTSENQPSLQPRHKGCPFPPKASLCNQDTLRSDLDFDIGSALAQVQLRLKGKVKAKCPNRSNLDMYDESRCSQVQSTFCNAVSIAVMAMVAPLRILF